MKKAAQNKKQTFKSVGADFFENIWEESWTYIKTVVDAVREPILILDKDLRVMAANEPFYRTFQVSPDDTENKIVYELGNGQWNIPALRKLLEDILPKNTFFRGFEVTHRFPSIGEKVILLNARQIHCAVEPCPPIILLAMEDVTEMMGVAEMLAQHTKKFQTEITERAGKLETHIKELEKEMGKFKKKTLNSCNKFTHIPAYRVGVYANQVERVYLAHLIFIKYNLITNS